MTRLCILAGSPRSGGNSDTAAQLAGEAAAASGMTVDLIYLRDHRVRPCIACDFCLRHPGLCRLDRTEQPDMPDMPGMPDMANQADGGDDAGRLFSRMAQADVLLLAAPVYFYGPPAGLKALIDRGQRFWTGEAALAQTSEPPALAGMPDQTRRPGQARRPEQARRPGQATRPDQAARPALAILCAAREGGERLFDASLLILRCFMRSLGRELRSPLLLRGLDKAQDLRRRPDLARQVEAFGREAAVISGASAPL